MNELEAPIPKVKELTAKTPKMKDFDFTESKITPLAEQKEKKTTERMKIPEMSETKISFPQQRPSTPISDKNFPSGREKVKEIQFSSPKVKSLQSETKESFFPVDKQSPSTDRQQTEKEARSGPGSMTMPDFESDRQTASFSPTERMKMPEFDSENSNSSQSTTFGSANPMDRLASVLETLVAGMQQQEEFPGEPMPQYSNVFGRSDAERSMAHYPR